MLRPGGIAFHAVDLADHLGGALNHLRFSERVWECSLMANSGFYTNRLQHGDIVALARSAGLEVAVLHRGRWTELPTSRAALAAPFRDVPEQELKIAQFNLLLRKPLR